MGTQYLIDSNAVIEYLGGLLPERGSRRMQQILDENRQHLSIINKIELLGYNGSADEMRVVEDFIDLSSVLPLTEAVVNRTIELRKHHKIKLPDAVIAATALHYDLVLITRNVRDFQSIEDLRITNLHELV